MFLEVSTITDELSPLKRRSRTSQIIIITNFVVVSSVSIKRVHVLAVDIKYNKGILKGTRYTWSSCRHFRQGRRLLQLSIYFTASLIYSLWEEFLPLYSSPFSRRGPK